MYKVEELKLKNDEAKLLIEEYQKSTCDKRKKEISDLVIRAYYGLVLKLSRKFTGDGDYHMEDYLSCGCKGIVNAMEKYDGKVAYFSTFVYRPIIWEMGRYAQTKKDTVRKVFQIRECGGLNYVPLDFMVYSKKIDDNKDTYPMGVEELLKCPTLTVSELKVLKWRLKGRYLKAYAKKVDRTPETVGLYWRTGVRKIRIWLKDRGEVVNEKPF
jgi:hypothetical protein